MKKTILFISFIITSLTCSYAQTIEILPSFNGYKYLQNEERKSMRDLVTIMRHNSEALLLIKSARRNTIISNSISGAGGVLIGYTVVSTFLGDQPDFTIVGIGIGLALVTIPITLKANRKAKSAIAYYNSSTRITSSHYKKLNIAIKGNGLGITFSF